MGFNVVYQQFRSAVTGPDSSRGSICQHTEVPCHRWTWYPTKSL